MWMLTHNGGGRIGGTRIEIHWIDKRGMKGRERDGNRKDRGMNQT